jgi:hypothetical protein
MRPPATGLPPKPALGLPPPEEPPSLTLFDDAPSFDGDDPPLTFDFEI